MFIQTQGNIIEKTLGAGETIYIRPECLLGFSSTVTLKKQTTNDFMWFGGLIVFSGISARSKFLSVKGPGLLYIEMKQGKTFFKKD